MSPAVPLAVSPSPVESTDHFNQPPSPDSSPRAETCSQYDDIVDLGPRLQEPVPFDDGFIAFGTIQIYDRLDPTRNVERTYIRGANTDDLYPNNLIKQGLSRRWIRTDGITIGTKDNISTLRVYVLPEDVDRSDRGSLKDFRKLIRYLLNYIDCSTEAWQGKKTSSGSVSVYREPLLEDEQSLFYIFNTLNSPEIDLSSYYGDIYSFEALTAVLSNNPPGLKTQLYPYQQRSVVAMLKRESSPAKIKDVRKLRFLDIYGKEFFLDLIEGSVCRHRSFYTESQGGVLAETMGYGKTLICLALILATRGHYARIPSQHVDISNMDTHTSVPTLLQIAARKLRHEGLPWKQDFYNLKRQGLHYDACVTELQKYERVYNAFQIHSSFLNPSRKGKPEYMVPIRLSAVTLVIVPPNLVMQWQHEIQRHIDPDALDVLVLSRSDVPIPSWKELISYDIVLISKARFEQEYRDDDLNQGRLAKGAPKYQSPLTEIRWLRVICDEGHGFAGSSSKTKAMAMLEKMAIERRWVVSGTPSSSLHGVEVGMAAMESSSPDKKSQSRGDSLRSALENARVPQSSKTEKTDFERLRLMVVNFLKLQPWANRIGDDKADFKDYLAPRTDKNGHRHGVPALRELLQNLFIRHRIEDIDHDLVLPALHNKVVYIKPSYYDKLTINLFTMILISNYVTSEREDEDYMFHPKNHKKLSTVISNMSVATFHWMGITEKDVRSTIKVSNKYLDEHIDSVSDSDGALLTEAIMTGEKALSDPGWCAFSNLHEIGTFITDFPENAREVWALDGVSTNPLLMGTTQAREVQRYYQAGLVSNHADPLYGIVGTGVKTMSAARSKAQEIRKQNEKSTVEDGKESREIGTKEEPKVRAPSMNQSPIKLPIRKNSGKGSSQIKSMKDTSTDDFIEVPNACVVGFSSSKLSYLTHRLLHVHPNEKTIIFYANNNTAFFIAEALELLQISFRIYADTLSVSKRAEYLAQFNVEDEFRVLLMDLKQAALGLHIAVASRVYIMTPIWDPALESQAIKRAHRIGQMREVFVETLVLAGTFEESMVRRRAEKQVSDQTLAMNNSQIDLVSTAAKPSEVDAESDTDRKDMLNDVGMVNVLKNIRFLRIGTQEDKIARLDRSVPLFSKLVNTGGTNNNLTSQTPNMTTAGSDAERSDDQPTPLSAVDRLVMNINSGSDLTNTPVAARLRALDGIPEPTFPTQVHTISANESDRHDISQGNTVEGNSSEERPSKKARFI